MEVIKRFGDKVFARDVSASVAGADRRRHDRLGSTGDMPTPKSDFRFTRQSRHPTVGSSCPKSAVNNGHQLSAPGCPLIRHPLSEVCPAHAASTTMRMAWMTTG